MQAHSFPLRFAQIVRSAEVSQTNSLHRCSSTFFQHRRILMIIKINRISKSIDNKVAKVSLEPYFRWPFPILEVGRALQSTNLQPVLLALLLLTKAVKINEINLYRMSNQRNWPQSYSLHLSYKPHRNSIVMKPCQSKVSSCWRLRLPPRLSQLSCLIRTRLSSNERTRQV